MKIGLDSRTLTVEGGSRTYAYNLIAEIINNHKDIELVLFGGDKIQNNLPINPSPQKEYLRLIWENLSILPYINKERLDIFHGLKNVAPYYKNANTKSIITVHDIMPLLFPSMLPLKTQIYWKLIRLNIKKADKIIAVSNTTKEDIIDKLNIENSKISVIYHGVSEQFRPIPDIEKEKKKYHLKYGLTFSDNSIVIMAVSSIKPTKNYVNLIEAFRRVYEELDVPIHLLIVGKVADKKLILNLNKIISNNNLSSNVHFLGYVPDEELTVLYNLVDFFVFPSFYEGFGLPILEAQACGCPVITSNISSMPEVAGDGAILVDPYSVEEIANAIHNLVFDLNLRKNLIQKGFENCALFSWKRCAEETLNVYKEVYSE